jgi:acetyl-CoA synthetase
MRFVGGGQPPRELSYAELARQTSRFANGLARLGVQRGECLFILAGRIPETTVAMLGALKAGVVVSPLSAAFGPDPIATRVNLGEGRVLLTTESLYRRKLADWRTRMPGMRQVVVIARSSRGPGRGADARGTGSRRRPRRDRL